MFGGPIGPFYYAVTSFPPEVHIKVVSKPPYHVRGGYFNEPVSLSLKVVIGG